MKILAVTPYRPQPGGGARASSEIFKRLSGVLGADVDVLTYKGEAEGGVRVFDFDMDPEKTSVKRGFTFILKAFRKGLELSREKDYDLVYGKNLVSCGFAAYLISFLTRKPLVLHTSGMDVQNLTLQSKAYGRVSGLTRLIFRVFLFFELRRAVMVIANSRTDSKSTEKLYRHADLEVVYDGVDTERFTPDTGKGAALREELGIEGPVIGYCGRAAVEKNIGVLLRLARELPDCTFLFVGPTPSEFEGVGIPTDNCILTGMVIDVERYYQAMDIYVHPTLVEGLSNSVTEALATGVPVVSYPSGDSIYFVDGTNGYIVNTYEETLEKVNHVLGDEALKMEMGENARETALVNFNWQKTAEAVNRVFKNVLKT